MKIFEYLEDTRGIAETYKIYEVVQNLKPYAMSKYGVWWEDALDEAFFHIYENFDASRGDLENYATRVVGTIYLNRYRKEITSSEKTEIELDSQEALAYSVSPELLMSEGKSSDLGSCIIDTIPYFLKDFKFFMTFDSKDRKLKYDELLSKYTGEVVREAKEFLVVNYADKLERILDFSKKMTLKNFQENRYLKSLDTGLEYIGTLNDIVIVRRGKGSHTKRLYKINIKEVLDFIIRVFYSDEAYGKVVIEGVSVYLTTAGNIVIGEKNLKSYLERELVGSILSRTPLRVIQYNKGEDIIFSSTKDSQNDLILPMFEKTIGISFDRLVCKEVD